jgi:predicted ArsR family transcriptional regulator
MNAPKNTREHVIMELKRAGSLNTKDLSFVLGISSTAVRQLLTTLQAEGLVNTMAERQPQGRPCYVYTLTEKGHNLFPEAYDALAMELLETVREIGGEQMLQDLVAKQVSKKEERYRKLMMGRSLAEKLIQLRDLREDDGYMAVVEAGESKQAIREHNCPIFRIAKVHPEVCAQEIALMERLLGASIDQTHHILDGQFFCRFEVTDDRPLAIETPLPKPS